MLLKIIIIPCVTWVVEWVKEQMNYIKLSLNQKYLEWIFHKPLLMKLINNTMMKTLPISKEICAIVMKNLTL